MDSERWERVQDVFHAVADLPHEAQAEMLCSACGGDSSLLAEVEAMLRADVSGASLLDAGLARSAEAALDGDPEADLSNRRFGPYVAERLLGEGGMGVVYLARRDDLGSVAAIKVLRDAWLSPARRQRFLDERRMLARLNHPSIARLYDAGVLQDGTPWFAMEYVEGVPLTEYCERYHCSIERRLQLFRLLCEAVQYAHQHALIHRDLKPSNVLVTKDGGVRLLDFGIAKQMETSLAIFGPSAIQNTLTGFHPLTPAYAAPEQVRGEPVSVQTDVYALGVILFELFAGKLPFDLANLSPAEAAAVICEHEPVRPSMLARQREAIRSMEALQPPATRAAWSDLDTLCLTAMHKESWRRYRSAEALIRDINRYLAAEPLEARPDSIRYRAGKFVQRNRRAVFGASLAFLALILLAAAFTVRLTKAHNVALAEAARAERIQNFMMNLFEGGDSSAGPSNQMRVLTLVERGEQEARGLSGAPTAQAELYLTIGDVYRKLGQFDRADALLQKALEQRKKLFGPQSAEVAETLVAISQLRARQAKFTEAEDAAREAVFIDRKVLPTGHPELARAISQLGTVQEDRGAYPQAISTLEEAVRLQSAHDAPESDLAASLSELANSHFYAGHYAVSEALNQRLLALDTRLFGGEHPRVADDLINLGAIQLEEGHPAEAEKYDRQALDITKAFYGDDSAETASAMTLLGRAMVTQGHYNQAASMLEEALAIEERVYGKVHPRIASTLNELGKIEQKKGRLEKAKADFRRMASIYRKVYNGNHYYIGIALSNLAGVFIQEKQYAEAERLFRETLAIYSRTLPSGHQNVGIARIRLGRALLRQHREADALAETRAGYEIVGKQSHPPAGWLKGARKDMVEEYDALDQPQNATILRSELAHDAGRTPVQ